MAAALAIVNEINTTNSPLKKYCIFDFGGGTFDVSILEIEGRSLSVKSIAGDSHLGGVDIDNMLAEYLKNKIE